MRVLVAGAAGFIGSHLCDRLLARGCHVVGVDNLLTSDGGNLAHLEGDHRFEFLRHDVVDPLAIGGKFDWVLHFASPASPPKYLRHPIETLRCNAEGTRALLEFARGRGAQFLFASTSEIYGDPDVHPQPEDYWGHVSCVGPRSVYDEAKRYGEALVTAFHQQHGVSVRIVRIFNTYGPRMTPDDGRVVVNFIVQALAGRPLTVYGTGAQTRSFQYVDDLVDGLFALMRVRYFRPVNIGNPEEYSMLELARLVREVTGSRSSIVHRALPADDPKQRRPDIALARTLLEWTPSIPVREGLRRTAEHYRARLADERASEALALRAELPVPGAVPAAVPRPARG